MGELKFINLKLNVNMMTWKILSSIELDKNKKKYRGFVKFKKLNKIRIKNNF